MTSEDTPFDRYALPPLEGVTDVPTPAPVPPVEQVVPPLPAPSVDDDVAGGEMDWEIPEATWPEPDASDAESKSPSPEHAAEPDDEPDDEERHDDGEPDDAESDDAEADDDVDASPAAGDDGAYFASEYDDDLAPAARRSRLRSPIASAARAVEVVESLAGRRTSIDAADDEADAVVIATAAHSVHDVADTPDAAGEDEAGAPSSVTAAPAEDEYDALPDFLRAEALEAAFGIQPGEDERMSLLEPEPHLTTVAEEPPMRTKERAKPTVARTLAEIPVLLIVAALIAFLVKTFLAQAYYIPSGSMLPQLQIDDRVVVSKLAYKAHDPRRGDIVVFDDPRPEAVSTDADEDTGVSKWVRKIGEGVGVVQPSTDEFIKRVIGLPGEKVSGHDGFVFINGHKLLEPYLPTGVETSDFPAQTVADGKLWVMGDNRGGSADSRVFGQIKISSIVGRAMVKVWPFDHISFL